MESHTVVKCIEEEKNIPLATYNLITDWIKQQRNRETAYDEIIKALDAADQKMFKNVLIQETS